MGIEIAIAGLVLAAVGTAVQIDAAKDAAKAQEDAGKASAAVQRQRQIEQRRASFRKRRIAAARIEQASENTGTAGSSAEAGAVGGLSTQAAAFRGSINATQKAGDIIAESQTKQREAGVQGQLGGGITSIGTSIFAGAGGPGHIKNLFAPET